VKIALSLMALASSLIMLISAWGSTGLSYL
jgi:hypothetical protein